MSDYEDEPDYGSVSNSDDEVDEDYGICPITGQPISECIEFNGTYFDKKPLELYLRSECAIERAEFNGATGYARDFYSGEFVDHSVSMIPRPDMQQSFNDLFRKQRYLQSNKRQARQPFEKPDASSVKPAPKAASLPCMGELYQGNTQILTTILRQAERQGLMDTLAHPHRTQFFTTNVPIYFASGGICAAYRSINVKKFQTKFKKAESEAEKSYLQGAHSSAAGAAGESIPEWMAIFHRYFDLKKSAPPKSKRSAEFRTQLQTTQRTLLQPSQALGSSDQDPNLLTEHSSSSARHPSAKSLVASGGTITLVPINSRDSRNNNARRATSVSPVPVDSGASATGNGGTARGVNGSSLAQMPDFVSAMNTNLRILMKRSFREINADYEAAANGLTMAERAGDRRRINFYENACKALQDELLGA